MYDVRYSVQHYTVSVPGAIAKDLNRSGFEYFTVLSWRHFCQLTWSSVFENLFGPVFDLSRKHDSKDISQPIRSQTFHLIANRKPYILISQLLRNWTLLESQSETKFFTRRQPIRSQIVSFQANRRPAFLRRFTWFPELRSFFHANQSEAR